MKDNVADAHAVGREQVVDIVYGVRARDREHLRGGGVSVGAVHAEKADVGAEKGRERLEVQRRRADVDCRKA